MSPSADARMVAALLLEDEAVRVEEATVRRPPRSTRWVAVFTGQEPGDPRRGS